MGIATTFWAPVHRALARNNAGNTAIAINAAPSLDYLGAGIQDHRLQANSRGSSFVQPSIVGWYGTPPMVANFVPSTLATANIAALANAVSGTGLTLVAVSGAGITVLTTAAPAFFMPTGRSVSAGVAIDGLPSLNSFGNTGDCHTAFYSRSACVGRAVSITGSTSGTGGNILVSGYDCYGYPMSELIAATAGATTANGKKAFKVITSVVPAFTDAHAYSVGTTDIFGLGIRATVFGDLTINWNSALVTAATGFVAAVTTDPATTTTGDVRGTYAVQTASDNTKRLVISVTPSLAALSTNPTTGLFGVAQA